jgi:TolB-like protein/DNA-binding winged helix-turn-helix (wHTH) protein
MQTLAAPDAIVFGPFVLDLGTRALSAGGEKLAISSRAFDILVLLVTERERVVGKDEIIAKVWRNVAVEENNLAVQISSLRRVLSEHSGGQTMIVTVPGQGYRFVARVEDPEPAAPPAFAVEPDLVEAGGTALRPAPSPRRIGLMLVGAALVVVVCVLGARYLLRPAPAPRLSIAVLPFRNLGDDKSQDYLADAISDDLTTDLSRLPGSVVIARESSDVYKGRAVPAEQIGRALHVRYLLEGSLRAVDGIFRINAQLIDAQNGAHLWADRFDVARDKLAVTQSAIVGHIASALDIKLLALESDRSLHERPDDPDALDLYFRARSIRDRAATLADLTQAQQLLEKALALQPEFADALAELGVVLLSKISEFDDPDDSKDHEAARRAIERAVKISSRNEDALTAQGLLRTIDGQIREGEASFQVAAAADPNNAAARAGLAYGAWLTGKPDVTINELNDLLRLDPQGRNTKKRQLMLGEAYFLLGKWQDAIDSLLRCLAGDSASSNAGLDLPEWGTIFLAASYDRAGEFVRAKSLYEDYKKRWPNRSVWRLSSYFRKAQIELPGFRSFQDALIRLGMPLYAPLVFSAEASTIPQDARHGDFDPAPQNIPGSTAVDVADVVAMLRQSPSPVVIDVGTGAATLPGAIWVPDPDAPVNGLDDRVRHIDDPKRSIIIVGSGVYGWNGYLATQQVVRSSARSVLWLRGGEEALAASGVKVENRREP